MIFNRKPRWLCHEKYMISLDRVDCFTQYKDNVYVYFNRDDAPVELKGITLADIHYFLKHGKRKR